MKDYHIIGTHAVLFQQAVKNIMVDTSLLNSLVV